MHLLVHPLRFLLNSALRVYFISSLPLVNQMNSVLRF